MRAVNQLYDTLTLTHYLVVFKRVVDLWVVPRPELAAVGSERREIVGRVDGRVSSRVDGRVSGRRRSSQESSGEK